MRIDGTNEPTDFNSELVDVEIRHGDGKWPGLFVEGLVEETFIPVCAPTLAAPGSLSAVDVLDFRLIHSVKSQAQWSRWLALADMSRRNAGGVSFSTAATWRLTRLSAAWVSRWKAR